MATRLNKRDAKTQSYDILNAAVVDLGEYLCLNSAGTVERAADTAGFKPLGFSTKFEKLDTSGPLTGDSSASPIPEVTVEIIPRIVTVTVVGGSSAALTVGKPVYVTGPTTFTLVETSNIPAVGVGVRFLTGTTVDVLFFGADTVSSTQVGGIRKFRELVTILNTSAMEGTAAVDVHRFAAQGEGRIIALRASPTGFDTGYSTGSQTLNLEIATTNLTGGALLLSHTDIDALADLPVITNATTITAANEFSDGQTISLEMATDGQAFNAPTSPQSFHIWMDVERGGS